MLKQFYKALEKPTVYDLVQKVLGQTRLLNHIKELISKELLGSNYLSVVDIGCGTGILKDCFLRENYMGIDINEKYLQGKGGRFIAADSRELPFQSEVFDIVCTLGVLHHLNDRSCQAMLYEMHRVCKEGGLIFIIDGLIPSSKLNVPGYLIARLDRGGFKIEFKKFRQMIGQAYSNNESIKHNLFRIFPNEYVFTKVVKEKD